MFDIHSHIVFGVDDGSRSYRESRSMLRAAKDQGIDRIMCTPHCRWDSWDKPLIQQNFAQLKYYAESLGIQLDLGYEVNWRKLMELGIESAPQLKLGNTRLFLLEFSDDSLPPNWERLIYQLQGMGLDVIIAHPERYRAVQSDIDIARQLKDMGCFLQLSADFIQDSRLAARRRTASALLKEGLVDYIASDAHCADDYAQFAKALKFCRNQ